MRELDPNELKDFFNRNLDNLHKAYKYTAYNDLVNYNKYLISSIKFILSGHIISILSNEYYLSVLSKIHTVTATLSNGRIDINDFIIILGSDEDEEIVDKSMFSFDMDIYMKEQIIFTSKVIVTYYDESGLSFIDFKSDLLDNEFSINNDYDIKYIINNIEKLRKVAMYKNDMLNLLSDKLYALLDPKEAENIIHRPVFIYKEGEEDE